MTTATTKHFGVVLRAFPSREADLVLRLLTQESGKFSVLAKHARRSKRRFGASLDLFDRGTFELSQGKGDLPLLTSFVPAKPLIGLRDNLDRMASASILCEACDYLTTDGSHDDGAHYLLLEDALDKINAANTCRDILATTFDSLARLLQMAGYLDRATLGAGSINQMRQLLLHVERSCEKKLVSKEAFSGVLREFRETPGVDTFARRIAITPMLFAN